MRTASDPGRPRPTRWAALGSGLLLATLWGGVAAASPPAELRKVYALLAIDTLSGLGESVKIDGERVDRLLSTNLPKDRVEIRMLTGKDVTADAILSYFRGLKVGRDDALLFYYAGHGATDPQKGHFLALQDLEAKPLMRADLRRAMQDKHPGLVVVITDCCSTRFKLPNKSRRIFADKGSAGSIDPVLRCLLFQSRGVVDVTASTGNASFGDDHDGGIFTRTLARLVDGGVAPTDADRDGFVSWPEFFSRLQSETQNVFVTWAQRQRARGEDVDQTSQRPHAFALGGNGGGNGGGPPGAVSLHNETAVLLRYQYRWAGESFWEDASIPPNGFGRHVPPPGGGGRSTPALEVRFEKGKTSELRVGKTYRFHGTDDRRD